MSKATFEKHPLSTVTREATSDENIASLHQTLIDLDKVDNAFLEAYPRELLQEHRVHLFLVQCWLVSERWQVLARAISTNPHECGRDRALQECERARAVGKETDAVLANVCDLSLVSVGELELLVAIGDVEVVGVGEGSAGLQVLSAEAQRLGEVVGHRDSKFPRLAVLRKACQDAHVHHAVPLHIE